MSYFERVKHLVDDLSIPWEQMTSANNPGRKVNYWQDRIAYELIYMMEISVIHNHKYLNRIEEMSKKIIDTIEETGSVTKQLVLKVEEELKPTLEEEAKKYTVHCVSHAHIDMNWLWGYHETVQVTLDTFRTMLDIMKEYPDFTYSQSQGSVYRIVEEYDPDMLQEIKARVKEGRWELAASTWVENDKNMPNGESMVRHITITKQYLQDVFGVNPDEIKVDFEPDTFGHNANVPEILVNGGVKYYYHCRGNENNILYNWESSSGERILVFRDPIWYGNSITPNTARHIPSTCEKFGLTEMLYVYGVGDHGGGPTRRDIEAILDMNTWPLFPKFIFSTYHKFFQYAEKYREQFPVVTGEMNFVLTGCYTSSSRMKMANRYSEASLYQAEFANLLGHELSTVKNASNKLSKAWRNTLFNQFHDILPGCGMVFTREFALGKFQEILATANQIKRASYSKIIDEIKLSNFTSIANKNETAYGAGAGINPSRLYGDSGLSFNLNLSQVSRGIGPNRAFYIFNSTEYGRNDIVTIMLWDYKDDLGKLAVYSSNKEKLPFVKVGDGYNQYWGHWYTEILVQVTVPSFGYETVVITQENEDYPESSYIPSKHDPRVNHYVDYVLENDYIVAEFDPITMDLIKLTDKQNGLVLIENRANFRYIQENAKNSNAWVVGDYVTIDNCRKQIVKKQFTSNNLLKKISYTLEIADSKLDVEVILKNDAKSLEYKVVALWNQIGDQIYTPQLNYHIPLKNHQKKYIYDIPMGLIERGPINDEVPGNTFAYAKFRDDLGLFVITESKYGYRGLEDSLSLTLLRSTSYPDTHPETGVHYFSFRIGYGDVKDALRESKQFNNPMDVISGPINQVGKLDARQSFINKDNPNIMVSAVKNSEKEDGVVIRMYSISDKNEEVNFTFAANIESAYKTDYLERVIQKLEYNRNTVGLSVSPYKVVTLKVSLKK